ncbi:helix-turn-helix transcriptional regulator [uncultured Psychroserpens sp.]|uniref:helix-turn-helix domain-containing protein n=1 Tax=uncultured Psychroserpens sp. TaxID=255436 RepID=UPI002625DF07|nr:helix-turn-helix transcriptional regulator [uncultured Psychroserpens sp.]
MKIIKKEMCYLTQNINWLTFLVFTFLFFEYSYSQQRIDEYKYWYDKAQNTERVKNDSTIFYAEKAVLYAKNRCDSIRAIHLKINSIHYAEQYTEARSQCLKVIDFLEKNLNKENESCFIDMKSKILERIFYVEKNLTNYLKALEYLEKNKQVIKDYQQYFPSYYFNIKMQELNINLELFNYDKARKILAEMLKEENKKLEKEYTGVYVYSNLLQLHIEYFKRDPSNIASLDSAHFYNKKRHGLLKILDKDIAFADMCYFLREGSIAFYRENYKMAIDHFRKALAISARKRLKTEIDPYFYMTQAFFELNQADSTLYYANKTLDNQNTTYKKEGSDIKLKMYHILSKQYKKIGKDSLAYIYAEKELSETRKKNVEELDGLQELSKIDINEVTNTYIENQKSKDNQILYGSIAFACMIIFGIVFFQHTRLKNKRRFNSILKEIKNKDKTVSSTQTKANFSKSTLDIKPETITKILDGLQKLEKKHYFLKSECNSTNVAKKLKTNTTYLSKVITIHYQTNFNTYINDLRINYALERLKNDSLFRLYSIQSISEELGYKSPDSFTKYFKKSTGLLPSYFIKKLNKQLES